MIEQYCTPGGYRDTPFIYVYNIPSVAVNGSQAFAQLVDAGAIAHILVFTAIAAGELGNNITINVLNSGLPSQPLTVTVVGLVITVQPATSIAGVVTSTTNDVANALALSAPASALISTVVLGDGTQITPTGLVVTAGGASLIVGATPLNQSVKLSGGEDFFLLRSIDFSWLGVGPLSATDPPGGFNYGLANVNYFSGPRPIFNSAVGLSTLPICPELAYAQNAQMFLSLYGQANDTFAGDAAIPATQVEESQILFRGVRRYPVGTRPDPHDKYVSGGWREESYAYVFNLTIDWLYWLGGTSAGGVAPLRTYTIDVNDWDFELMDIRCFNLVGRSLSGGGEAPTSIPVDTGRIVLYDPYHIALMSDPVNLTALDSTNTISTQPTPVNTAGIPVRGLGAMCPSVVYPKDTQIQFQIQSLISTTNQSLTQPITIVFLGKRRWQQ